VSPGGRDDLLYGAYGHFADPVMDAVRRETFGTDIGQNSWLTVEEFDHFLDWLDLAPDAHVLEVACGSGGPALHLARMRGCRVTGLDVSEAGVAAASRAAEAAGLGGRVRFHVADANARLPFGADTFDGIACMDALNHLSRRLDVLREWQRVLRPGRRAVFTDPVVVTGPVTNDELALRSSIGTFLFVPPGINERLIEQSGLRLVRVEDATANAARLADRWRSARDAHQDELIRLEGESRFGALQRFFEVVHELSDQRRLSRIAYFVEKPVG
jgi:SAM-dependent methyltransferase